MLRLFTVSARRGLGALVVALAATTAAAQNAAVDDIAYLRENGAEQRIDVLHNDFLTGLALAGGRLEVVTAPTHGTLRLDTGANPSSAADDAFLYAPAADWAGTDRFAYRICSASDACFAANAIARTTMGPSPWLGAANGRMGRTLVQAGDLRALADLRFATPPLVPAASETVALGVDPSRHDPWTDGGGRAVRVFTLPPPADGKARDYQVIAWASHFATADAHLYVGVDADNNGQASASEVRCVSATGADREECELALTHPGTGTVRYWAMLHSVAATAQSVDLHVGAVPMIDGDGSLAATGPATLQRLEAFHYYVSYERPALVEGDVAFGTVRLFAGEDELDRLPTGVAWPAGNPNTAAAPLGNGQAYALRLGPGEAQDRLFIDVPVGASSLTVVTDSDQNVDLYLAPYAQAGKVSQVVAAPARGAAAASAIGAGGDETLTVSGASLSPGRWYVTPVNQAAQVATLTVTATIATATAPVRPGSYFNSERAGHGIFLYPAGGSWAALWYAYAYQALPTWYYAEAPGPGADGIWRAPLYQGAWNGTRNRLTKVGQVVVTPQAGGGFMFSHTLHGVTASEPMQPLGRGCPTLASLPVDVSSHWFDPRFAGTGYSVQMWPTYEYYAAFIYDRQGLPRYLAAEHSGFGGADATLALEQLNGFTPAGTWFESPTRETIGTLRRVIADGRLTRIEMAAAFTGDVPGVWTSTHDVQTLGGAGTTQGCAP